MITRQTRMQVADNTGARTAMCVNFYGQPKDCAHVGDVIKVVIKEAQPKGLVKKSEMHKAVIVRTKNMIHRADGSGVRFDHNAVVLIDEQKNPIGSRIFGPVARELRDLNYLKLVSLAPEVV